MVDITFIKRLDMLFISEKLVGSQGSGKQLVYSGSYIARFLGKHYMLFPLHWWVKYLYKAPCVHVGYKLALTMTIQSGHWIKTTTCSVCMCVCVCVCVRVHMHTHASRHAHTQACTYTHALAYAHTHTHSSIMHHCTGPSIHMYCGFIRQQPLLTVTTTSWYLVR